MCQTISASSGVSLRWEDIFPFYDDGERRDGERAVTNFDALERMFDDGS